MSGICKLSLAATFVTFAGLAAAQSLPQYLALRKKFHISTAAEAPALDTLVGSRVLEITGRVVGSVTKNNQLILLLADGENRTDNIRAKFIPDWLIGQETQARLLVSAKRESGGVPRVELLGVARSSEIDRVEVKAREDEVRIAARMAAKPLQPPPTTRIARRQWNVPLSEVTPYYAAYIRGVNKKLSPSEATRIAQALVGFSIRYGVDARLIIAMVVAESDFNPNETSSAGAMGLGQLMPGTAKDFGISNAYDTTANLYGTVREIHNDLSRYHNRAANGYESLRLALAAYNAGIGAVARAGGVPNYRETQAYVKRVIKLYAKLCN